MKPILKRRIIIIGAGPAGVSAAVQLTRSGINVQLISREIGGLAKNANLIENLPMFPHGISGTQFCDLLKESVKKFQIPFLTAEVFKVDRREEYFYVETDRGIYRASYLVIALGTKPNQLTEPEIIPLINKGRLLYERYRLSDVLDGLPSEEKHSILVIGSGDAAYDYALSLANGTNHIDIAQRGSQPKALKVLVTRVNENEKICVLKNSVLAAVRLISDQIEAIIVSDEQRFMKKYDYILVAIGRSPNLDFIDKHLIHDAGNSRVWLVGDVKNEKYRQIAIASGDGIKAAMEIVDIINNTP